MTRIRFTVATVFALVCLLPAAFAQDAPKTINGGALNGKAISLPKPVYPEAARAAGISGMIGVNIVIDESGTVISAEADPYDQYRRFDSEGKRLDRVEADITLREASEAAARLARFAPTQLAGRPVQVKGWLTYNFIAGMALSRPVSGGVLNGRAIELPKPAYPAAAVAVRAVGMVSVQIAIDETGSVISANAISGHPLLRAASEKAALEAKFQPTYLDGKPVMVSGVLTYNFVGGPKKDDQ